MMDPQVDILGVGCVAVDELYYVADYPTADSKAEVLRTERHCEHDDYEGRLFHDSVCRTQVTLHGQTRLRGCLC